MPTYQYACRECDHAFDQVQGFTDDSLTECPQCEGRLRKVFNAVGVVFKGSGFYRNDSREQPKPESSRDSSSDSGAKSQEANGSKSESGSKSEPGSKPTKANGSKSESGSTAAEGSGSSTKHDGKSKAQAGTR